MKFERVVVGGSFDPLHRGHKALLDKAFESGERIIIGLTSDEMINKKIKSYSVRKSKLESYLSGVEYQIVKLDDPYGIATKDPQIDAIIVSEETRPRALEINRIREKENLRQLEIITIPMILAEDGRPISSTMIRDGEIDEEGKILR